VIKDIERLGHRLKAYSFSELELLGQRPIDVDKPGPKRALLEDDLERIVAVGRLIGVIAK
jgi:hypothetical protein